MCAAVVLGAGDPYGAQLFDHFAVVRLGKEGLDALRNHRANVVDFEQLLGAGVH